jgi:hypothetical protein
VECTYCGREVKPTIHRREGPTLYRVDYYRLLTGRLERVVMQDPLAEKAIVEFYKLLDPRWVIACVDCYRNEDTRIELNHLFAAVPEPTTEADSA